MAISADLRARAVARYERNRSAGETYESVAKHYEIGRASLDRWLHLKRETGGVADRPRKVVKRSPIDMDWLRDHAMKVPDATLKERAKAHQVERGGEAPSVTAVWSALQRLGFTHKKRRSTPKSETPNRSQR